jgi:hypothetical protein
VRLTDSVPAVLGVTIGQIMFLIYDQRAFASLAEQFLRATEAGRAHLPEVNLRHDRVRRGEPGLAGAAAEHAANTLLQPASEHNVPGLAVEPAVHPAMRAAAALRPPRPGAGSRTTGPVRGPEQMRGGTVIAWSSAGTRRVDSTMGFERPASCGGRPAYARSSHRSGPRPPPTALTCGDRGPRLLRMRAARRPTVRGYGSLSCGNGRRGRFVLYIGRPRSTAAGRVDFTPYG